MLIAAVFLALLGVTYWLLNLCALPMPHYKLGQTIIAKINGVPQEVKIRTIIKNTDGLFLIADFGFDQVATIHERDIVRNE